MLSFQAFFPNTTSRDWILLFVAIEHVFLAIRLGIDRIIPDESKGVKFAMDRDDYILKNLSLIHI